MRETEPTTVPTATVPKPAFGHSEDSAPILPLPPSCPAPSMPVAIPEPKVGKVDRLHQAIESISYLPRTIQGLIDDLRGESPTIAHDTAKAGDSLNCLLQEGADNLANTQEQCVALLLELRCLLLD